MGKLENVRNLRQIAARGDVAYITAREDGLFVVDVTDRTAPKLLSHYDTIEFATGIALKDQYAFVARAPVRSGDCSTSPIQRSCDMSPLCESAKPSRALSPTVTCMPAPGGECRVAIRDVRNPADPKQVATVKSQRPRRRPVRRERNSLCGVRTSSAGSGAFVGRPAIRKRQRDGCFRRFRPGQAKTSISRPVCLAGTITVIRTRGG